jgi:hypothetical protein
LTSLPDGKCPFIYCDRGNVFPHFSYSILFLTTFLLFFVLFL